MTKNDYHPILERQIRRTFGARKDFSPEVVAFFDLVNSVYIHADEDRSLIERSLELSSKELSQINQDLMKEIASAKQKAAELEKMNSLMIGRELRMIQLKEELAKSQQK